MAKTKSNVVLSNCRSRIINQRLVELSDLYLAIHPHAAYLLWEMPKSQNIINKWKTTINRITKRAEEKKKQQTISKGLYVSCMCSGVCASNWRWSIFYIMCTHIRAVSLESCYIQMYVVSEYGVVRVRDNENIQCIVDITHTIPMCVRTLSEKKK